MKASTTLMILLILAAAWFMFAPKSEGCACAIAG